MSESKSLCKWCNIQVPTNKIIKVRDNGFVVWIGCFDCYTKKKEIENNAETKK